MPEGSVLLHFCTLHIEYIDNTLHSLMQLFDRGGVLYAELARFVFRILGIRRKSRKIGPVGPNGLPLPASDMQNDQKLIEGPKAGPAGGWDNVWGNDASK